MKNINNFEIKAKCSNLDKIRDILKSQNAEFKGKDNQIDTYFKIPKGRLKLRQGTIENNLIHYERDNQEGPKQSNITLYKISKGNSLKDILIKSLDILVVVDKQREIYFIKNVKFHIDQVKNLGSFIEIEAIDKDGTIDKKDLLKQCKYYINLLKIKDQDLVSGSYSDLLLKK